MAQHLFFIKTISHAMTLWKRRYYGYRWIRVP